VIEFRVPLASGAVAGDAGGRIVGEFKSIEAWIADIFGGDDGTKGTMIAELKQTLAKFHKGLSNLDSLTLPTLLDDISKDAIQDLVQRADQKKLGTQRQRQQLRQDLKLKTRTVFRMDGLEGLVDTGDSMDVHNMPSAHSPPELAQRICGQQALTSKLEAGISFDVSLS
jgi:hypothetical protein